MSVQSLEDKLEIHELLARYARGVDARDWDVWKSVFTDEAFIDYSSAGAVVGGRDEVADWLEERLGTMPMTQHFISNVEIELDGDRATVRALFFNPIQPANSDELALCGGAYVHDLVRTSEGWKSQRLVEESAWFADGSRLRQR